MGRNAMRGPFFYPGELAMECLGGNCKRKMSTYFAMPKDVRGVASSTIYRLNFPLYSLAHDLLAKSRERVIDSSDSHFE